MGTAPVAGEYKMAKATTKPCTLTIKSKSSDINYSPSLGGDANVTVEGEGIVAGKPAVYSIKKGRASFPLAKGDTVTSVGCGTWNKV